MMKKLLTWIGTGALTLLLSAGLSSCEGDKHYYEVGADLYTEIISVQPRDWSWNAQYERYEAIFDWDEIDRYMYLKGSVTAGVYVTETAYENGRPYDYEVLRSLPFVHTYYDGNNNEIYTRTIGFDIGYASPPGQITFYIQDSDLREFGTPTATYRFKVTLIWRQ
ncbi:MAG: hypothetical protein LUD68_00540 [Rikenellaceae bacterium]|nr:hypothetical protein [Rikenellaceae bacterium]